MHEEYIARFWACVDRSGDCWLWTGSRLPRGYGRFYPKNKVALYAHRVSWEVANGMAVPDGLHICHTCDNPSCVRPGHLFAGTRSDNMQDAKGKGRLRHPVLRGERHPSAKLTESAVVEIRLAAAGGESRSSIAARHGVTKALVNQVVWRKAWAHVV